MLWNCFNLNQIWLKVLDIKIQIISTGISQMKKKIFFYHVSTDEVYGALGETGFTEETSYDPKSPYSASKAAK